MENELYAALVKIENSPRQKGSADDLLNAFVPAIPVINRFFDAVMVMADDPAVRANRLGLFTADGGPHKRNDGPFEAGRVLKENRLSGICRGG